MTDRRPNVLVICTDQQRFDVLSCYGNTAAITPNVARLADHGVIFDHCYSTSTVCAPARGPMMTGKYPHAQVDAHSTPTRTGGLRVEGVVCDG